MRSLALALALLGALTFSVLAVLGYGAAPIATACYFAVLFGVAFGALLRAATVARERIIWLLVGLALLSWSAGFLYWRWRYEHGGNAPTPSISDGLELSAYPLIFIGMMLLARARLQVLSSAVWLDGLAAALAAGAIGALVMADPLRGLADGSSGVVLTGMAYPVGDFLLVGLTVGLLAVRGTKLGTMWILILAGGLIFAVTDCVSLYQSVAGTYTSGSPVDIGWMLGILLIGSAAWQPIEGRTVIEDGQHSILLPVALGTMSLGVLNVDHFHRLSVVAVFAATISLAVILQRLVLTFALSRRLIVERGFEALIDPLTGLGNRRAMTRALETTLAAARDPGRVHLLAIFDLNGFKHYNDTFGHVAGDLLLTRLSLRLSAAAAVHGATAYRMGGDEFCVFGPDASGPGPEHLLAWGIASLTDRGEGFTITASGGHTIIDANTAGASAALSEADERMYGSKRSQRASPFTQTTAVLRAVQDAVNPGTAEHTTRVAELAVRVARQLDLPDLEVRRIRAAAELHNIGMVAIPITILQKPEGLDENEWAFVRRHTIIGQHIVQSAPALEPVAELVRGSHERWDGEGYPDGLAGDAIPLGSQICFVCDAFDAMTSDRPYRLALSSEAALAEVTASAGSQFSPRVVAAFVACWRADHLDHATGSPVVVAAAGA